MIEFIRFVGTKGRPSSVLLPTKMAELFVKYFGAAGIVPPFDRVIVVNLAARDVVAA